MPSNLNDRENNFCLDEKPFKEILKNTKIEKTNVTTSKVSNSKKGSSNSERPEMFLKSEKRGDLFRKQKKISIKI
ncbi:MAG: hypothetical protein H6627_04120 [Calditrichae bacterium]|nr:hypothetical protein [Calditrichota bacterium]MCB9057726.1 hypothetical protein [Calditrichia bacterium]